MSVIYLSCLFSYESAWVISEHSFFLFVGWFKGFFSFFLDQERTLNLGAGRIESIIFLEFPFTLLFSPSIL